MSYEFVEGEQPGRLETSQALVRQPVRGFNLSWLTRDRRRGSVVIGDRDVAKSLWGTWLSRYRDVAKSWQGTWPSRDRGRGQVVIRDVASSRVHIPPVGGAPAGPRPSHRLARCSRAGAPPVESGPSQAGP